MNKFHFCRKKMHNSFCGFIDRKKWFQTESNQKFWIFASRSRLNGFSHFLKKSMNFWYYSFYLSLTFIAWWKIYCINGGWDYCVQCAMFNFEKTRSFLGEWTLPKNYNFVNLSNKFRFYSKIHSKKFIKMNTKPN